MNNISKEQIIDLVYKLASEQDSEVYLSSVEKVEVTFIKDTDNEKLFEVTQMYESPIKNNFKYLKAFSNLFGTDNIDIYEHIANSGCETCDYGSSYGYAIRVWK